MVIKTLLKTVDAGSTVLTFTDEECTDDMIYDVYVDDIAVLPTNVTVVNHTVTVNFKEAQTSAVQVKIVINALEGSLDASDIPYDATDTSLTADNVEDAIDELDNNISANVSDIEQLQLDMVQAQSDIAGKAETFTVNESINLSEGRVLSTEASIIPFDNSLIGIVSDDVQGAIEEAYNHTGTDPTITTYSDNGVVAQKQGKLVILSVSGSYNLLPNTTNVLTNLPADYRPVVTCSFTSHDANVATFNGTRITVNSDGRVYESGFLLSGNNIGLNGNIAYFTN